MDVDVLMPSKEWRKIEFWYNFSAIDGEARTISSSKNVFIAHFAVGSDILILLSIYDRDSDSTCWGIPEDLYQKFVRMLRKYPALSI